MPVPNCSLLRFHVLSGRAFLRLPTASFLPRWALKFQQLGTYSFRGLGGQLIIILPDYDMVIMRVGEKAGDKYEGDFRAIGRELIKQAERWQAN